MRLLLAGPLAPSTETIERRLVAENFIVELAADIDESLSMAAIYDYDCIVLLGEIEGATSLGFVQTIRRAGCNTPVVCGLGDMPSDERVRIYAAGADAILKQPYQLQELVAQVQALVRRDRSHPSNEIVLGNLTVMIDRKTALVNGKSFHLTATEYRLLELLMLRQGVTITKAVFMAHLYAGHDEPEIKIIDVMICKLRSRLKGAGVKDAMIETVWGRGYRMVADGTVIERRVRSEAGKAVLRHLYIAGPATLAELRPIANGRDVRDVYSLIYGFADYITNVGPRPPQPGIFDLTPAGRKFVAETLSTEAAA